MKQTVTKQTVTKQRRDLDLAAVRAVRPAGDGTDGTDGWAASADGRAVLRDILRRTAEPHATAGSGRRRRLLLVGGAAAVLLGGATTAAVATLGPWGDDGRNVMCARTLSAEADLSDLPLKVRKGFDPHDAARSCAAAWDHLWQGMEPRPVQPARFAACYYPNAQPDHGRSSDSTGRQALGGPVIYPADGYPTETAACAAIGSKPVVGG